jgi:hypothetical protein
MELALTFVIYSRLSQTNYIHLTPAKDSDQLRQLYLATNLIPYRGITYTQKGKVQPAVEAVLRDSLKVKHKKARDACIFGSVSKLILPESPYLDQERRHQHGIDSLQMDRANTECCTP